MLKSPTPLKKVTSLFPGNPPSKNLGLIKPPLFENLVRGSKSRKEGEDLVGIPSPIFPHLLLHTSRYAHVLESLFNKVPGLTVAVLLTTVFFSSYLTSSYKFKNLKRTAFKICDTNTKYLRLKSPKCKARKLKLQKNYYLRQQNNKMST